MSVTWFLIAGVLLVAVAVTGSLLKRLPLTTSMFYLGAGALLGPWGAGLLNLDVITDAPTIEVLTELAVIISLFTAGLKLRLPFADRQWRIAILLAVVAMTLTIVGITAFGVLAAGMTLTAALLLGAVLAPTDPVLASDVQVAHEHDAEPVRFSLTGEAGFNDGTAFPFVMLGLGLLGAHELGDYGWRWLAVDVVWAVAAGLAVGAAAGAGVGRLVLYMRRAQKETVGFDEFLALGLISLSYGIALQLHAYGFLAVFAAGLSMRRIERQEEGAGPAKMARAVLDFNEQLERLGEVAVVVVVGALLAGITGWTPGLLVALALFGVIRPAATALTLVGSPLTAGQRAFVAWFGVRGAGSIYYLAFALAHGAAVAADARLIADITLVVVAVSIVVHGVSVTPLMRFYAAASDRRAARRPPRPPRPSTSA
jgi:NhaP-type Na+/H+ or K+/H+ antiporter